jgi:hypothetical protein
MCQQAFSQRLTPYFDPNLGQNPFGFGQDLFDQFG